MSKITNDGIQDAFSMPIWQQCASKGKHLYVDAVLSILAIWKLRCFAKLESGGGAGRPWRGCFVYA